LELLTAGINALVVTAVGLVLLWFGKERFEALDGRMTQMEARLDGRMTQMEERHDSQMIQMEVRLERRLDALQSSQDAMRSDLTQVALAVGVRRRATNT
jgi:hypothetical protein